MGHFAMDQTESSPLIRLVWVTNIPTPYRVHRYEVMANIFPRYGLDFEVFYMAWTEKTRNWTFTSEDLNHPHRIFRSLHFSKGPATYHLNPGMIAQLRRARPDVLVVAGISNPTTMLAPFTSTRSIRILSAENNPASTTHTSGAPRALKRFFISRYDGYVVTGPATVDYLKIFDPSVEERPIFMLPQLVDPNIFGATREPTASRRDDSMRTRLGVTSSEQLWVIVARLEEFKGLRQFLPHLKGLRNVEVRVFGEGSLRESLKNTIARDNLPVRLMRHVEQAELSRVYAAADLFVLPSLGDPSPLAAVEAIASGLPLLVSSGIGNVHEVLIEGRNGWSFNVADVGSIKHLIQHISTLSRDTLASMGKASTACYWKNYDSERCVTELAIGLQKLVRGRSVGPSNR